MRGRPEGETGKERFRQMVVGVVAVIALLSIFGNVVVTSILYKTDNNYHAATVNQDNEIIALQQGNAKLGKQHTADIENESQLLQNVNAFGAWLYNGDLANCSNIAAIDKTLGLLPVTCPTPLPSMPSAS